MKASRPARAALPVHPLSDGHLRPGVHTHGEAEAAGTATHKKKPRPVPALHGSFPPPRGTLLLGVGRQPNHFTCGAETFLGITELLRLPHRAFDMGLWKYRAELHTSYKSGTAPEDIARGAREHLGIEARLVLGMSVAELARLTNTTQHYADALTGGAASDRPLTLAMVDYQAYIDPAREISVLVEAGKRRELPVRAADGAVLWENDWSDGHWSAVVRVVLPSEKAVLQKMLAESRGRLAWEHLASGVVILGDPSNGEGLSFIPIPEFERRWHDTNPRGEPEFEHAAVVFTVPAAALEKMKAAADQHGLPMFSTVQHNSVIYVP